MPGTSLLSTVSTKQLALTKTYIQMRRSLSLPFGFLFVKYLVATHALAHTQKEAIAGWILEGAEQAQTRAATGTRSIIRGGLEQTKRVAASKPCQVRLGGIKVKEINGRPAPSANAGMLLANGRWLQDWAPIETGAQPGQVGNKMKRVLSSGWGHRRHFLHLPSFFKGHKGMGSGQTYGEHLSAASHPACPHSPVTLPTRIPRNSCNLWHCLAVSV